MVDATEAAADNTHDAGEELFSGGATIESLEINGRLKEGLMLQGFKSLTNVQQYAYDPILMCEQDVLIKSATGSGKTVAYLLPLLENLLRWTKENRIDRTYGTIGIVLVPTRELAEQCYDVLGKMLRKISFIVGGCITGGEQRSREKARLRKGIHVLVATIGRLLDHLRTTESFDVSKLQYIVFDEADRLLDMGYEKDIKSIKGILDERNIQLKKSILVSATLGEGVKRLSHYVLKDPVVVGDSDDTTLEGAAAGDAEGAEDGAADEETFTVPPTLTQHFVIVPAKARLSLLLSLLRWKVSESQAPTVRQELTVVASNAVRENIALIDVQDPTKKLSKQKALTPEQLRVQQQGVKIIVFCSSADSVEFHYRLMSLVRVPDYTSKNPLKVRVSKEEVRERRKTARAKKGQQKKKLSQANAHLDDDDEDGYVEFSDEGADDMTGLDDEGGDIEDETERGTVPFIATDLFKLHGNMSQLDRASVYETFRRATNGILFATDVAARGLDMPGVRYVIQYDLPTDIKSFTHRIGRTARAGQKGDAITFVQPHEEKYLKDVQTKMSWAFQKMSHELILFQLSKVFHATHLLECASVLHSRCEKAVLADYELRRLSAIAYQAYMRAYNMYPKELWHIFNVQQLHLGHVAKSFAIQKNPTNIGEIAKESRAEQKTVGAGSRYEPTHVRKSKMAERYREGGDGMTRHEAEAQAAKKAFRKPIATSRVGQFSEFADGGDDVLGAPRKKRKLK